MNRNARARQVDARLVCVSHLPKQRLALGAQDRHVVLGNGVDGLVVDLRVLVHEPVAKADDEACVRDAVGEHGVATPKRADRLADDGELALDG